MEYGISKLIDVAKLRTLTDHFFKASGISLTVADPNGSTLVEAGRRDICDHFLLLNPETSQRCIRCDTAIADRVRAGREYTVEKCTDGLFDTFFPITVLGEHIGTFVAGPFLLHPPNTTYSKRQARRFGFDVSAYVEAVSDVPVLDEEKLHALLRCFSGFAEILGQAAQAKLTNEMDQFKQAGEGQNELEQRVLSNMKELILPSIERLKMSGMSAEQVNVIENLESNLKEITSPVIRRMQTFGFSARESAVASLIREGKTTKGIADLLGVSPRAVEFHRYNIRKKLGIDHERVNLRIHLLSIV